MPPHDAAPPERKPQPEPQEPPQSAASSAASAAAVNDAAPIFAPPPPAAAAAPAPVSEAVQAFEPADGKPPASEAQSHESRAALALYISDTNQGAAAAAALRHELLDHERTSGLQVPTPEAQARAKPFFERWIHAARALAAQTATDASDDGRKPTGLPRMLPPHALSDAAPPTCPRQYPIAQGLLPDVSSIRLDPPLAAVSEPPPPAAAHRPLRPRPPAGAPSIRPAAPRREQPADVVPRALLQATSESALIWHGLAGETFFRIDFSDDFFKDSVCIITVLGQDIVARFYVADVNARRLLEAEQRRLQNNLQARGLGRAEVRIVMGAPPEPFAPLPSGAQDAQI